MVNESTWTGKFPLYQISTGSPVASRPGLIGSSRRPGAKSSEVGVQNSHCKTSSDRSLSYEFDCGNSNTNLSALCASLCQAGASDPLSGGGS